MEGFVSVLTVLAAPLLLWICASITCEAYFWSKERFINRLAEKMKRSQ